MAVFQRKYPTSTVLSSNSRTQSFEDKLVEGLKKQAAIATAPQNALASQYKESTNDAPAHYAARQQAAVTNTLAPNAAQAGVDYGVNNIVKPKANTVKSKVTADKAVSVKNNTTSNQIAAPIISSEASTYTIPVFEASDAYYKAMEYTQSLLDQLNGGRTSYTSQIEKLLAEYQNREDFAYDAEEDVLFQNALALAMADGRTAMQDTIGQASALTGGYGSTYATAAGNNAYNRYIQEAYDNMPEYYQLALDAYNQEGQNMLTELALLQDMDSQEYNRLANAYSMNASNAANMYTQEYGAWADSVANKQWEMSFNQSVKEANADNQYRYDALNLSREQWEKEYEQLLAETKADSEYKAASMQLAKEQWEAEMAEEQRRYNLENGVIIDAAGNEVATGKTKTATQSQREEALKVLLSGGQDALDAFCNSIPDEAAAVDAWDYAMNTAENGFNVNDYTKTKDTWNGFSGIDHNDVVSWSGGSAKISERQEAYEQYLISIGMSKTDAKKKAKEFAKELTNLR